MPIMIFQTELGDEGLEVNENGTVTYFIRSEPALVADGSESRNLTMSSDQAKSEWPSFALDIDRALARIRKKSLSYEDCDVDTNRS